MSPGQQIVVGVADCRTSSVAGQVLATYALGSCIGLAVYDPQARVGGLLHFMLPDSALDPERGRANPFIFADTGVAALLDQVCSQGADRRRLTAHAAGGASIMDPDGVFDIGRRNYLALRKILWKAGIMLSAEVVGGTQSRTVRLEIGTGRFILNEAGAQRELGPALPQTGGTPWRTAS